MFKNETEPGGVAHASNLGHSGSQRQMVYRCGQPGLHTEYISGQPGLHSEILPKYINVTNRKNKKTHYKKCGRVWLFITVIYGDQHVT